MLPLHACTYTPTPLCCPRPPPCPACFSRPFTPLNHLIEIREPEDGPLGGQRGSFHGGQRHLACTPHLHIHGAARAPGPDRLAARAEEPGQAAALGGEAPEQEVKGKGKGPEARGGVLNLCLSQWQRGQVGAGWGEQCLHGSGNCLCGSVHRLGDQCWRMLGSGNARSSTRLLPNRVA